MLRRVLKMNTFKNITKKKIHLAVLTREIEFKLIFFKNKKTTNTLDQKITFFEQKL